MTSAGHVNAGDAADPGELVGLIGEDAVALLAEHFGGTRLYIPAKMKPNHRITAVIGGPSAKLLSDHLGRDVIRVPIARDLRAKRMRASGMSNGRIARNLGITEPGVTKIFQRIVASGGVVPAKGSAPLSEGGDE